MAKFRKKPIVIDAWQWNFSNNQEEAPRWVTDALNNWPRLYGIAFEPEHPDGPRIIIATLEGVMVSLPGDYIIKGVIRELYSCKKEVFEQTYEKVTDETNQ